MSRGLFSSLIGAVSASTLAGFAKQCRVPRKTQEKVLEEIITTNKNTAFGIDYKLNNIRGIEDWQKSMPILTYDEHQPYVERALNAEANQLTSQSPILFATTSGTTGASKYIPVTAASKAAKSKLMRVWLSSLHLEHPEAFNGKALTVVSPEVETYSPGGIPCGAESGHGYRAMPGLVKQHYSTPYEVYTVKDYEAKYYALLRIGCSQDISLLYTCNPSTILVLAEKMGAYTEDIIRDVRDGTLASHYDIPQEIRNIVQVNLKPDPQRATQLEAAAYRKGGVLMPSEVWPSLASICCWKGGTVGMYLNKFDHYFTPGLPVRDIGYFASEVRGSVVLSDQGHGGVLSITENFLEFSPVDDPSPAPEKLLLADQLEVGRQYYIYVTTKGGLYRYDMNDIIEVSGMYENTPVIQFIQKGKGIVSFTGEKLSETQVIAAVDEALMDRRGAYELITVIGELIDGTPRYAFMIEFDQSVSDEVGTRMLAKIETGLRKHNLEYGGKRDSMRIGAPVLRVVKSGEFAAYRTREVNKGRGDGQFKTLKLTTDEAYSSEFRTEKEITGAIK